ncbi:MAG TPA: response regulator [Steroidobacter sp.]|jgi:DNA-binding response OmpR family regulator
MLILIVEDDPICALSVAYALEEAGYAVIGPASKQSEALSLAQRFRPELALVDIDLENPGDGVELARRFREMDVQSVFVSAQLAVATQNSELALGLIGKPFDPEDVPRSVDVVAALMRGAPPPPSPRSLQLF